MLDDDSSDATAAVVARHAACDARVRLLRGSPLPPACGASRTPARGSPTAARGDELVFMDADVRLEPGALRRLCAERERWAPRC